MDWSSISNEWQNTSGSGKSTKSRFHHKKIKILCFRNEQTFDTYLDNMNKIWERLTFFLFWLFFYKDNMALMEECVFFLKFWGEEQKIKVLYNCLAKSLHICSVYKTFFQENFDLKGEKSLHHFWQQDVRTIWQNISCPLRCKPQY